MIKIIQILLQGEEYNFKEYDRKAVLFKGIYPEDYVEIEKVFLTGKFVVSEVHRDVKQIKAETEEKEDACIYAVVIYKKLYDDIVDRMKARSVRNLINAGEEERALSCCIDGCNESVYSIDYEDNSKISLIRSKDQVDVKFGGEYLVQSATLSRGYVAFHNYCEKLQHISLFYIEVSKKLDFSIEREKILRLYMLGK